MTRFQTPDERDAEQVEALGEESPDRTVADPAFRVEHPELYGLLLSVNERLDRSGRVLRWFFTVLWGAACTLVMLEPVETIAGFHVEDLQHVGFYLILAIVMFATYCLIQGRRRTGLYATSREDIYAATRREGLTQEGLVTGIEGRSALSLVSAEIKADTAFDRRRR